jgi:AcrR family transcriptional regulator
VPSKTRRPAPHARTFELMWGRSLRTGRGPKPALSRERTVQAAIELADADGLDALTMSRVAARLGVTTMALYRHVSDKEQLVELMVDAALGEPPSSSGRSWRDDVVAWARAEFAMVRAHPWLLATLTRRSVAGPRWAAWLNAALAALAPLELPSRERLAVVYLVDGHVRSAVDLSLLATANRARAEAFHAALETAARDPRFPALAAARTSGGFDSPAPGEPDAFEFGLARVLDGVEVHARASLGLAPHGRPSVKRPVRRS